MGGTWKKPRKDEKTQEIVITGVKRKHKTKKCFNGGWQDRKKEIL